MPFHYRHRGFSTVSLSVRLIRLLTGDIFITSSQLYWRIKLCQGSPYYQEINCSYLPCSLLPIVPHFIPERDWAWLGWITIAIFWSFVARRVGLPTLLSLPTEMSPIRAETFRNDPRIQASLPYSGISSLLHFLYLRFRIQASLLYFSYE